MPLTKNQAADTRHLLEALAGTVPPSGEAAEAGCRLDLATAKVLDLEPVLLRPWRRAADRHALEAAQLEAEAAEDEEAPA